MSLPSILEESNEIRLLVQTVSDVGSRRIAITSWEDGAGKTTMCRLLALGLANAYRRKVVYVDINLRHPHLKPGGPGFCEGLKLEEPELVESRCLPPEFHTLGSFAKREALASLFSLSDPESWLLVDTSPLGVFNRNNIHPVSIREWVSDFLVIVNSGTTTRGYFSEIKELCKSHGLRLLGVVVNRYGSEEGPDQASLTRWKDVYRQAHSWVKPRVPVIKRITLRFLKWSWKWALRIGVHLVRRFQKTKIGLRLSESWKRISES